MENIQDLIPKYYDNLPYILKIFPDRSLPSEEYKQAVIKTRAKIEKDQKNLKIRIPVELIKKKFHCDKCGNNFFPNWSEFHWPIRSVTLPNGNVANLQADETRCTICNQLTTVHYPKSIPPTNQVIVFHDEAYRSNDEHLIISGIMCHKYFFNEMDAMLAEYKKSINVTGRLHMKDIWNEKIKSIDTFIESTKNFCQKLSSAEHINIFCSLHNSTIKRPKEKAARKSFKRQRFMKAALMLLTHELPLLVQADAQPILIFDRDNENEKWLEETFAVLACTLMFPFATNMVKVPTMKTIAGGSNAGSEIADFVCYLIARSIDGKSDVDTTWLKDVMYIYKDRSDGSTRAIKSSTVPKEYFFQGD